MRIENPIKTNSKQANLKDGTSVEVVGQVFDSPIFPTGEFQVYNLVKLVRVSDNTIIGCNFYPIPFGDEELIDKVNEIAESPDQWLAPAYRN